MKFIIPMLMMYLAGCGDDSTNCSRSSDCYKGEVCAKDVCVPESAVTTTNNSTPNNTTPVIVSPNSCLTDRASAGVCNSPDINDAFPEVFIDQYSGCGSGEVFKGLDETRSMQLCTTEERDSFMQVFSRCSTKYFAVEVTFTPKNSCDRSAFKLHVSIDGKTCDVPDDNIRCTDLPNGGLQVTAMVTPGNTSDYAYFTIESLHAGVVQFDYDLQWVVRE